MGYSYAFLGDLTFGKAADCAAWRKSALDASGLDTPAEWSGASGTVDQALEAFEGDVAELAHTAKSAAGRRIHVAPDPGLARRLGEALAAVEVHPFGQIGLELAGRIVGDPGDVDHDLLAREDRRVEGADVGPHDVEPRRELLGELPERVAEIEAVEHGDLVPTLEEERDEGRADVTTTAGDEDLHGPAH